MSQDIRFKRRRLPNLEGRRVPQTASQLTGGLESNSFFVPSNPTTTGNPAVAPSNQRSPPPGTGQPTGSAAQASPPLPLTPPTSTNQTATPSTPSRNSTSSSLQQQASTPTKVSNSTSADSTGTPAISDPLPTSTQKLAVAAQASSNQPNRDLSTTPLVNNAIPPNLAEAIGVAVAALAFIIGGFLFYWFNSKRKKKRMAESESVLNPMVSTDHLSRSGSISSIKRPINGPIDKKTIRLKKKTESIVSFGPGPEPELNRYQFYNHNKSSLKI